MKQASSNSISLVRGGGGRGVVCPKAIKKQKSAKMATSERARPRERRRHALPITEEHQLLPRGRRRRCRVDKERGKEREGCSMEPPGLSVAGLLSSLRQEGQRRARKGVREKERESRISARGRASEAWMLPVRLPSAPSVHNPAVANMNEAVYCFTKREG